VNAGAFQHRSNRPDERRFPRVPSGVSNLVGVGLPLHEDITHLRAVVFMIRHRIAPHKRGRCRDDRRWATAPDAEQVRVGSGA
jgi:hypothetical protein